MSAPIAMTSDAPPITVVMRPTSGPIPPRLNELWAFRGLFTILVWRDIKVRYAQTKLGFAWMLFQPLALLLVYTFAFSHLAKVTIPGIPYPVFALSGLTLWIFVSRATLTGAESLVANIAIVTKTSAPRILIPLAANVSVIVDYVISFMLFLFIAAATASIRPGGSSSRCPFCWSLRADDRPHAVSRRPTFATATSARPFRFSLRFGLPQPDRVSAQTPGLSWETLVQAANPLVGLLVAFRWALLGTPLPHGLSSRRWS